MIFVNDCVIYDYDEIGEKGSSSFSQIAEHTANTWQKNRGAEEKLRDTKQGKLAEEAVSLYFSSNNSSVKYISYDDFRADDFKKHAPFDGVIVNTEKVSHRTLTDVFDKINSEIKAGMYGHISCALRREMTGKGIFSVEIKSTKINDRKRSIANFKTYNEVSQISALIASVCADDFLTYPHYIRSGDFSWIGYCDYVKHKNYAISSLDGQALFDAVKNIELSNMDDLYIRVYVDDDFDKALILGYITKEDFMAPPELKKMVLRGKSENALYLAKSLSFRKPLRDLLLLLQNV